MNEDIEKAIEVLMQDGLIVYPTDTLYGLGADAFSEEAIYRVYEAKGRESHKPLSIAVSDMEMIHAVAHVDECAEAFINAFLPGPVTIILEARSVLPSALTAGTGKIGIRFPNHPVALELIRRFDNPITATSANKSGGKDPIIVQECMIPHEFHIDVGPLPGIPSTVIDLVEKQIIRTGADLERVAALLAEWD